MIALSDPSAVSDPPAVTDPSAVSNPSAVSGALADRLVIGNELVVGETFLVHRGALTLQLRLRSLPTRLLLGDPSSPLGGLGSLRPALGFCPMLRRCPTAPVLELALAGTRTAARHNESNGDHDQHYNNDDRDYYTS